MNDRRPSSSLNRRSILLGGTTLAAVSALTASAPTRMAQAQQQARPVAASPAEGWNVWLTLAFSAAAQQAPTTTATVHK